jgi:hypothetical protein
MKLKSAMSDATGKWLPAVTWGESLGGALNHDAAAAHALMQAMDEFSAWPRVIGVTKRASELLCSWGFDSGEVE